MLSTKFARRFISINGTRCLSNSAIHFSKDKLRIGGASGFWGDTTVAGQFYIGIIII